MSAPTAPALRDIERGASAVWWLFLVAGIGWILLSHAILQFDVRSVWSISILFGIVLLLGAADELFAALTAPGWRWAHTLLAALYLLGGVIAFAWPGSTFLTLARLIAWYLLIKGTFDIVSAFALRGLELWWVRLIAGVLEIALAFWAAGYPGRSITLLVLWVGFGALARGITDIVLAFQARALRSRLRHAEPLPAEAFGGTAPAGTAPASPAVASGPPA